MYGILLKVLFISMAPLKVNRLSKLKASFTYLSYIIYQLIKNKTVIDIIQRQRAVFRCLDLAISNFIAPR